MVKVSAMPATSCAAGEALVWQSPSNTLACLTLTVASGNVSGLTTAIDARIAADNTKLPLAGGTMTGNINLANNQLTNVGYVHLQNKTTDPGMVAANNGFVWYNSTDKLLKYYDGNLTRAVAGYSGACTDGQVLKWDNTNKAWICGNDAGAGGGVDAVTIQGVAVAAVVPTTGQFMKYSGAAWTAVSMPVCTADQVMLFNATGVATCTTISGLTNTSIAAAAAIARTKLANGTAGQVLVNDAAGAMSSEAQLAVTRGGTGQSTYTDGQLLIGNSTGNTLSKGTLTAGAGVTITNGNGTITIATDPATTTIAANSILNSHINTSAAIARSKLASGTANRLVINTTGGVMADAAAITADRALVSDTNGIPIQSAVTSTELNYLAGTTSSVQTQLASKVSKAGDNMTGTLMMNTQSQIKFGDNGSGYVGFRAPAAVTTSVTYTLPLTDGTSGQILRTDGAGNLGWVNDGMGAIADGSIARTKIATGTANSVLINDATGAVSSEAQLQVTRGGTGSPNFTANGLIVAGTTGTSPLQALACGGVGRSIEWTGGAWGCSADFVTSGAPGSKVNYVLLNGGVSASGVSVSAGGVNTDIDLNLTAKGNGAVRVGSKFQVDYETVSKTYRTIASGVNTGTAINFTNGNLQYTTSDCGPMTLTGMLDGATYVLAVKGTNPTTCSFTAAGLNIKMPPDHGPTDAGKSTLYTFMVMGVDVYVSWVTGY